MRALNFIHFKGFKRITKLLDAHAGLADNIRQVLLALLVRAKRLKCICHTDFFADYVFIPILTLGSSFTFTHLADDILHLLNGKLPGMFSVNNLLRLYTRSLRLVTQSGSPINLKLLSRSNSYLCYLARRARVKHLRRSSIFGL